MAACARRSFDGMTGQASLCKVYSIAACATMPVQDPVQGDHLMAQQRSGQPVKGVQHGSLCNHARAMRANTITAACARRSFDGMTGQASLCKVFSMAACATMPVQCVPIQSRQPVQGSLCKAII
eukprot:1142141-Pelagomonas_calceolata.AAC.4